MPLGYDNVYGLADAHDPETTKIVRTARQSRTPRLSASGF